MVIRINRSITDAKSRLVLVIMTNLMLRLVEDWRHLTRGLTGRALDYESTMIVAAMISINADRLLRLQLDSSFQSLGSPLPSELLCKSNVSSVSAAIGINRETTRRRVEKLLTQRILVKDKMGFHLSELLWQHPLMRGIVHHQLNTCRQTSAQLARIGVIH